MGAAKNRAMAVVNGVVEACGNCNAFKAIPNTRGGFCRCKAPVPILVGMGEGLDRKPFPIVNTYHPQMPADGWCREYERGADRPIATAEQVASALSGIETEGTA